MAGELLVPELVGRDGQPVRRAVDVRVVDLARVPRQGIEEVDAAVARSVEAGRTERALSREWGEWLGRTAMPALRVADFNMSSVSPAT